MKTAPLPGVPITVRTRENIRGAYEILRAHSGGSFKTSTIPDGVRWYAPRERERAYRTGAEHLHEEGITWACGWDTEDARALEARHRLLA